jgi:mono/diheme cytochrome c family protein
MLATVWVAASVTVWAVPASRADETSIDIGRGLAEQICARCHAIGPGGESTHPDAPPFRTLHERYPVNALEEALTEGIVTGHPDMPEVSFEAEDAGALIDYMISVQEW